MQSALFRAPTPPFNVETVRTLIGPSPATAVFIKRTTASRYDLYQQAGQGRYWRIAMWRPLQVDLEPAGNSYNSSLRIGDNAMELPVLSDDNTTAQWAYTGTWSSNTSLSGTYGGTWKTCTVAGGYVTFTSPVAVSVLQIRGVKVNTGAIARVSIDGNASLATGLPTAQDLVTAGTIPSSALVANGGTLNPTDRCYDHYSAVVFADNRIILAEGLTEAVHTVKWEFTPYFNNASTGVKRVGVSGMSYGSSNITPLTASVEMFLASRISYLPYIAGTAGHAWEISFAVIKSTGPYTVSWMGASHGYESETAFSLTIDGTPTTMTDGQIISATTIVIDKVCDLFNATVDAGATLCAEDHTIYTFDQQGLSLTRATTWKTALKCVESFPAMMTLNGDQNPEYVDKYANSGIEGDTLLTADDDGARGAAIAELCWAWKNSGNVANSLDFYSLANLAVACNNHVKADPMFEWCQDRSGTGATDKYYVTRNSDAYITTGSLENMVNGDVWTAAFRYRARWLANTAGLSRA